MGHGCIVRSKRVGPDAERLETHRGSAMPQTGNSVQVQTVVHNNNVEREQGICKLHSVAGLWLGVVHYWLGGTKLVVAWRLSSKSRYQEYFKSLMQGG